MVKAIFKTKTQKAASLFEAIKIIHSNLVLSLKVFFCIVFIRYLFNTCLYDPFVQKVRELRSNIVVLFIVKLQ